MTIPAGVDNGSRLRLGGEGEAGLEGGPPGDLFITLKVKPHTPVRVRKVVLRRSRESIIESQDAVHCLLVADERVIQMAAQCSQQRRRLV